MSRKRRKRLKRERRRERREQNRNRSNKRNEGMKIHSYKNEKELKKNDKKWKNSRLRSKNPGGYERHLKAAEAFKNRNKNNNAQPLATKKDSNKGKKWKFSNKELRTHRENIRDTEREAERLKNYKPKTLGGVKRETYTGNMRDMPQRPNVPKLPTLNLPGGRLGSRDIKKPSGLPGTIKDYNTSGINLDTAYTAHIKKKKT